jgi:hypothetical protein
MQCYQFRCPLILGVLGVLFLWSMPGRSRASDVVASGWDLFRTVSPGTMFGSIPFQGVPLGSFDFGGSIGTKPTGNADTIVRRLDNALPQDPVIPVEIVALQLQSVQPIDIGLGLDFHYVTLQSARGGPASLGQMTINGLTQTEGQPHGAFDSFFDVFFDIRHGSLNGPIVFSSNDRIAASGLWGHVAPPGAVKIPDVNYLLNGTDISQDFWPITPIVEQGQLTIHMVTHALPEPGATVLFCMGVLSLAGFAWRRHKRAAVPGCSCRSHKSLGRQ